MEQHKEKTFTDKFAESAGEALNPLNLLWALLKFFLFGLLIGLPYLIYNLDKVFTSQHQNLLMYLRALGLTLWQGVFLGLSTVWDTVLRAVKGTLGSAYATIFFSVIILIFASLTIHEIVRIIFNILDMKKGHATPKVVTLLVAFFITFLVISPFAYIGLQGRTFTSGIVSESDSIDLHVNDTINSSNNITSNNTYVNYINLLYNNNFDEGDA